MVESTNQSKTPPLGTPHNSPTPRAADKKGSSLGTVCAILVVIAIVLAVLYWNKNTSATSLNAKLAQTNSDNSQLRSELDKANSNVADLRRQLDAGKTQEADITSRLDAAMAAQSALKSDLSKSHSDLTSQQRIAKDQQDALQGQIQQATDETGSLQKQLDQLKSENSDLKSKLADAQSNVEKAQPPAPAKQQEAVPVTATFEKAFFGSRYTLHMKDVGHDTLDVTVSVDGAARPATKIQAGSTLDIGDLKAGQMVMISSEGYQPLSVAVK